jgi:hypothetical protein
MESKVKFLVNKSYGFYITLALIILSIISAIVYAIMYNGSRYMSWLAVGFMLGGAVISIILAFTKAAKWSCVTMALADFIALLLYVYEIYFYVSIVMVGIQASTFNSQFKVSVAIFIALLVANVVNVFLKQVKED